MFLEFFIASDAQHLAESLSSDPFFSKQGWITDIFLDEQKLLPKHQPAYQWTPMVSRKQRSLSAFYDALKVIITLRCNDAFEELMRKQHHVEIRFGFGLLNIVQVSTTYTVAEMVDPKSQGSKNYQFVSFK